MNSILLGLLIGASLFCSGDAVFNLLGGDISVPLIKWDANSIIDIVEKGTEIWETCLENNVEHSDLTTKRAALRNCNKHLYSENGESTGSLSTLKQICAGFDKFKACYHKALKQVKNTCHLMGEDKEYTENAENIQTEISRLLCENDLKRPRDFYVQGKDCTVTKKKELEQCAKNYTVKDMEYDTDDCTKAWKFVGCVETEMESCKEGSSEIPVEVMKAGLMKTKCNDEDPSGGSSLTPVFVLSLLAGFFAVNVA